MFEAFTAFRKLSMHSSIYSFCIDRVLYKACGRVRGSPDPESVAQDPLDAKLLAPLASEFHCRLCLPLGPGLGPRAPGP